MSSPCPLSLSVELPGNEPFPFLLRVALHKKEAAMEIAKAMTPSTTPMLIPVTFPDAKLFPPEDDDSEPAVEVGFSSDEVEDDTSLPISKGTELVDSEVLESGSHMKL